MLTPELQHRIATWRNKQLAGTITLDEWKEAIIVLREARQTATPTATKPRKAPASADALLNELDGL